MTNIKGIKYLYIMPIILVIIFMLPGSTQAQATILVLESATSYSAQPFRSSPTLGVDTSFNCLLAGGNPPTLTGNGTLHDAGDWTQGGCDVQIGTAQPAGVFGLVFRISSYTTSYTSVFEYDNSANPSAVTNGGNKPPVQTVCITTSANAARVALEITCDVVDTTFSIGTNNTWVQMNGKRSPGAANTDEAISFTVDNIQWIVETTPAPTPTPAPTATPAPPPIFTDPDPTGLSGSCYICESPNNIFNVPLWIAKLICIIRNLFQCALRIWLENILNAIQGFRDTVLNFLSWIVTTIQDTINWGNELIQSFYSFFSYVWDLTIGGVVSFFVSLFDQVYASPLIQGALNANWIIAEILDIFLIAADTIKVLIVKLYNSAVLLVDIFIDISLALFEAPEDLGPADIQTELGIIYNASDLNVEGFNGSKVLWILLSTLYSVDFALGVGGMFAKLRVVIIGVLAMTLLLWTINKWRDIIPN